MKSPGFPRAKYIRCIQLSYKYTPSWGFVKCLQNHQIQWCDEVDRWALYFCAVVWDRVLRGVHGECGGRICLESTVALVFTCNGGRHGAGVDGHHEAGFRKSGRDGHVLCRREINRHCGLFASPECWGRGSRCFLGAGKGNACRYRQGNSCCRGRFTRFKSFRRSEGGRKIAC